MAFGQQSQTHREAFPLANQIRLFGLAIYRLSTSYIGRNQGRSVVQAAAYRARTCLYDNRTGETHDFRRAGVETGKFIASGLLLPEDAPSWLSDASLSEQQRRATLWNAVEAKETRKDAVLARDMLVSLPRELSHAENTELLTRFLQGQCVSHGMVADWAFHEEPAGDGGLNPHAHVLLTLRAFDPTTADGWGLKAHRGLPPRADMDVPAGPSWNSKAQLLEWREQWSIYANTALAARGHDIRIDHRSYAEQGIDAEPGFPIGKAAAAQARDGEDTAGVERLAEIKRKNAERIQEDPGIVIAKVARQRATFTRTDIARALHELVAPYGERFGKGDGDDDALAFQALLTKVMAHEGIVSIGHDQKGVERFATPQQLVMEEAIESIAHDMRGREHHPIDGPDGLVGLSGEQQLAVAHLVSGGDIRCLIGKAGSGKTTTLAAVRELFEAAGYNVKGAALAGIAAQNLSDGAGIEATTVASLRHSWRKDEQHLSERDVLIVDEAGMLGTRDMFALLDEAHQRDAKIILVGDAHQLQAIEAGATFRALTEKLGAVELTAVHRQRESWQAAATADLARGEVAPALAAYETQMQVKAAPNKEQALTNLVEDWRQDREQGWSQLMLAHTRGDVQALNDKARAALRERGQLGEERSFTVLEQTEEAGRIIDKKKTRALADGDRVIFLRNDKRLGVKNGTLGTLQEINTNGGYHIALDDGRMVSSDLHAYGYIDHGYATTIHKAQGVTVDRSYVLATPGFDRHLTYVAMTRHREMATLYWDHASFKDRSDLGHRLARENAKDNALDYRSAPAPQLESPPTQSDGSMRAAEVASVARKAIDETVEPSLQAAKPVRESQHPPRWKQPTLEYRPPGFGKPLSARLRPDPRPVRPAVLPAPTKSPLKDRAKERREEAPALVVNTSEGRAPTPATLTSAQRAALKALDSSQRRAVRRDRQKGHGRERGREFE